MFACEEPRPKPGTAINLLKSTIADMEIDYSKGIKEQQAISDILGGLSNGPLCPANDNPAATYALTNDRMKDLVGNVTAALFASMGITPSEKKDISQLNSSQLLIMYMEVLGFVYVYYLITTALAMGLFAAFVFLARRHQKRLYTAISIAVRVILTIFLAGLIFFSGYFTLAYSFMTSPVILYAFTLILLAGLSSSKEASTPANPNPSAPHRQTSRSPGDPKRNKSNTPPPDAGKRKDDLKLLAPASEVVVIAPPPFRLSITERRVS